MDISIKANRKVYDKLKEDDDMSEALMELMELEIKREEKALWEGIRKGIQGTVAALRDL